MNFLTEAFKALDVLNEDTFKADEQGLEELKDFIGDDKDDDVVSIIDIDAEDEEEVKDSYIGKVILCCNVCKSNIYKDKEDVVVDEDTELANVDEECPYCHTVDGFMVVGMVAPFEEVEVETDGDDEDIEVRVDGEEVDVKEDESITEDYDYDEFVRVLHRLPRNVQKYFDDGWSRFNHPMASRKYFKGYVKGLTDAGLMSQKEADLFLLQQEEENNYMGESLTEALTTNGEEIEGEFSLDGKIFIDKNGGKHSVNDNGEVIVDEIVESKKSEDDIDAIGDDRVERAKRRFTRVRDDADSRRDYMKKHDMKECGDMKNEACSRKRKKKVDEDFSEVEVTTAGEEKQRIKVSSEEVEGEETIVPVSDKVEDEIMMDSEEETFEEPVEETEETTEEEGIVEESLNSLCSKYLKENYSNVKSFRLVEAKTNGKKLKLEGIIKFASGAEKKTSFLFESAKPNARGKVRMLGENLEICKGKKAFVLSGVIRGNKLLGESLSYNYMTKNNEGKSQRVSGTVSNKRG